MDCFEVGCVGLKNAAHSRETRYILSGRDTCGRISSGGESEKSGEINGVLSAILG